MNIARLMELHDRALAMAPFPDLHWPPSVYYRFLGILAADLQAVNFVELGTCGGGAALNVARLSPQTNVYSIDIEKLASVNLIECSNFNFIQGDSIELAKTLGPKLGKIDLLFIDTIHTYEHTIAEYRAWKPYMRSGGVVCFDDLYRYEMDRVWNELEEPKTEFNQLRLLHLGGSPTDGGFGAKIMTEDLGKHTT